MKHTLKLDSQNSPLWDEKNTVSLNTPTSRHAKNHPPKNPPFNLSLTNKNLFLETDSENRRKK